MDRHVPANAARPRKVRYEELLPYEWQQIMQTTPVVYWPCQYAEQSRGFSLRVALGFIVAGDGTYNGRQPTIYTSLAALRRAACGGEE